MTDSITEALGKLAQLGDSIALELVLAEPQKDNGLLPVNNLLSQMEEINAVTALPTAIQQSLTRARQIVDGIFESTGLFDNQSIARLGSWAQWLQAAIRDFGQGQEILPQTDAAAPELHVVPSPATKPAAATHEESEEPLTLNIARDEDLLREFINESQEHLQNIELGVLTLEENPTDDDTLNSIFRAFHTFKGGSGFLNLLPINHLAHELESLLDLARQGRLVINSEVINVILNGGDTLKQFVAEMQQQLAGQNQGEPIMVPSQKLLVRIRAIIERVNSGAAEPAPIQDAAPAEETVTMAESFSAPKAAVEAPEPTETRTHKVSTTAPIVKVDTFKLDSLVDLVGEMVIAQSLVIQDEGLRHHQSQQLTRNLAQLERITKELQRTAMALRMVPVRATFQKMTRLVRDLAVREGKQVQLVLSGEETELDRTIIEEISDPLVHMIRNAVDHGVEKPEKREAAGKSPQGTITLRALHQGGNFVIEIKDDGAGLKKERLLAKGIEKGLVAPDANLSDKEIFNLIFAPGFSTAEKITDLSGRGVGMDVVRRNIEKLRGKVEIDSVPGEGTKFSIYLPLTLAIIDGLIVSIGSERYILPTLSVRASFRPTREMISTLHQRGEMINVRGKLCPLLRLYEYFNVTPQSTVPEQSIVIVVESEQQTRCLMVDRLLGKQEVVIKNLGETFKQNRALAGAAILGDGRVGLILDVDTLVKLSVSDTAKAA